MARTVNTDGFTALDSSDPLSNVDIGNYRKWAIFYEDFLAYDIAQGAGSASYTLTATNCVDTIGGATGTLILTLGGADNDGGQLQLTEVPFKVTSSKKLYFEARVNLTLASGGTVAANEIFVGLASEQTTTNFMNAGGTALAVDDCVGFVKYDAGAAASAVVRATDVESVTTAVWTPTDTTNFRLAFYYDGTKTEFYVDNVLKATSTGTHPSAGMTPTLWIKAGEAKANVLNVDYIFVAAER